MEKRKQDLMAWNSGKVFNGTCYPINPIRLWNDVYTQLGYEVGTEVPQLFSDIVPTTGFDSYKLVATNGSVFYFPTRSTNTYNAVVDEIVYQTKVANADAIEETARMFEQWVNDELSQRGEKSPFLTDVDPYIEEQYARHNYEMYKFLMGDKAMPYEEYKQTPQALNGLVYLTRDELQTFGKDLKHIFDTIQQKVDKETGNTLMYHKGDVVFPLNHVEKLCAMLL